MRRQRGGRPLLNRRFAGQVVEVELQQRLADMADRSIQLNDLADRYQVINADVKDVYQYVAKDQADVVVCNPPYFKDQPASQKSQPLLGDCQARTDH